MQPRDLEDVEVDEDMELDDELCRDIQMKLPDCLWQLDYVGRYAAGKFNEDFASLDSGERFLFGVIEVPFTEEAGSFTWGRLGGSRSRGSRCLSAVLPERNGRGPCDGQDESLTIFLAVLSAVGARVELVLHADRRPEIRVLEGSLAKLQARGMSLAEHEALDKLLFPEDDIEEETGDEWPEETTVRPTLQ